MHKNKQLAGKWRTMVKIAAAAAKVFLTTSPITPDYLLFAEGKMQGVKKRKLFLSHLTIYFYFCNPPWK